MKRIVLPLFFLLWAISSFSQGLSDASIDSLVQRSMAAFNVPGIAVAIIKDGKVIHSKGYGVRSLNTGAPVDENTLFGIASNSKAFTTTALGILVDQGKLKWDDKVRDYIPEFKLYSPYVSEDFTIRDLLTHRSGMGLGAGDLMLFPDSSDFTLKDIIYNLRFLKQTAGFRADYAYDNNLYIVAGEVVARVSGESWDDFVQEHILTPLGMTNSAPSYERVKDKTNVIDAHSEVDGKVQVVARSSLKLGHSAGGIYSSVADLSKWVLMHLADGSYGPDGKKLVSPEVHQEQWTPQTIIRTGTNTGPYNTHFAAYGLGFVVQDVKGFKQISHTGGLQGMVTQITMIPELHLGIIVLTNQEEGLAFTSITNQIKDSYLGIKGTDRVTQYSVIRKSGLSQSGKVVDSVWAVLNAVAKKGNPLIDTTAFTGTYTDNWLGDVLITVKNQKLWFVSKRSPKLSGELLPYKGNTYVVKWRDRSMHADAFVLFSTDENGKGSGITMKPVDPDTDFSYDFQDLSFHRK